MCFLKHAFSFSRMDELTAALAGSLGTGSGSGLDAHAPHPRLAQFKAGGDYALKQQKRREEFKTRQAQRRFDAVTKARQLALQEEPAEEDEEEEEEEEERAEEEPMDLQQQGRRRQQRRRLGAGNRYRNQLMLSEWMVAIPEDLEDGYLCLPVPQGKRCLLVAAKGTTSAYTKSGHLFKQFPTPLPGGDRGHRNGYCLLDAIFDEANSTFFLIDLMAWNGLPYYDSDTAFRWQWLLWKLAELPQLAESPGNGAHGRLRYRLLPLPFHSCAKADLQAALQQPWTLSAPLDGLLFYPKDAPYSPGSCPLVGWLKPFMLPQLLAVPVPDHFLQGHADQSVLDFITDFHQHNKHWKSPTKPDGTPLLPSSSPSQRSPRSLNSPSSQDPAS